MSQFIYVFDEKARDAMLAMQMKLLKSDEAKHMYVFRAAGADCYAKLKMDEFEYIESDILTF